MRQARRGDKLGAGTAAHDTEHVCSAYSGDARVPGTPLQQHGPQAGGPESVIMRPRRLLGTSRTPPMMGLNAGLADGGRACCQVCWNRIARLVADTA